MKKKTALIIVAGLVLLITLTLIFLPLIVRKVVVSNSKEWVGRSIGLKKLKINYFTGTVKMVDFKLFEADDSTVFVGFDTLIVDTEPYRYLQNDIVVEQLYLKGLSTNVVMYDSTFNFDDLLAFHQSADTVEVADTTTSSSLQFVLSNLEIDDAFFTLRDDAIDRQMELSNIDFFVPYISWDQEHTSEADLQFDFKNGGYFQSSIDVHPIDGHFDASIILNNLDITGYTDFVAKYMSMQESLAARQTSRST